MPPLIHDSEVIVIPKIFHYFIHFPQSSSHFQLLMHQQPPPLPPPTAAQAAVAQRLGGPVDASEGFGGALINVDQQKQLGFGGGLPSQAAQSAPEQLMMRGQFPPVSAG